MMRKDGGFRYEGDEDENKPPRTKESEAWGEGVGTAALPVAKESTVVGNA